MTAKFRAFLAWTLITVLTAANLTISVVSYQSERKLTVEVRDSLGYRLPQTVNAQAAVQPSAGKGATASVNGNDAVGQVNITTGANTSSGSLVHVKFTQSYQTQPFVLVAPMDQPPPAEWYTTVDQDGFDVWVGVPPKEHTNYPFSYIVVARPWLMYLTANQTP